MSLEAIIKALEEFKATEPSTDKAMVEKQFLTLVAAKKTRSVSVGPDFLFRFSEANTKTFSNVVLSLSALKKIDDRPVVICIVRRDHLDFRLANSTFLSRISHSSHTLSINNVRGSFLGHDILDVYEGIPNRPKSFNTLFAMHTAFSWQENLERLVDATTAIVSRTLRFDPTAIELASIFDAPRRAALIVSSQEFSNQEKALTNLVLEKKSALLLAAAIDNVNIRGNTIEQILTGAANTHKLHDLTASLSSGEQLVIDIKTKLIGRVSAPKAYNIDKMLRISADETTTFAFLFIAIDLARGNVHTRLISIFDPLIIKATRPQKHWAGRSSRGATQLTGDLSTIFSEHYRASVDVAAATQLLRSFIER